MRAHLKCQEPGSVAKKPSTSSGQRFSSAVRSPLQALLRLAAATLLLSSPAFATTYHQRTPESMALAADLIFVGTVNARNVLLVDEEPWTEVTFHIEEWLAESGLRVDREGTGTDLPATMTLRFLGGTVPGGQSMTVSGMPQLREQERWLVFAYDTPGLASPIAGVNQGIWVAETRGLRGQGGTYLNVAESGRLELGASGSGLEEILEALRELLRSGAPLSSEPASEEAPPEPPADEPLNEEAAQDRSSSAEAAAEGAPEEAGTTAQEPRLVRYAVNESGGPLLLSDAAARAARAWTTAAPSAVVFSLADDTEGQAGSGPTHLIGYGPAELFGPDALSFTLVRGGSGVTEVRVSPLAGPLLDTLLVHELGVLIGLPENGAGAMSSAVTEAATAPTEQDVESLLALHSFRAEDLNRDGVIDFYDLAILAAAYGNRGVNLAADLNGDSVVDALDLELLEAAYQFLPPSEAAPDGQ